MSGETHEAAGRVDRGATERGSLRALARVAGGALAGVSILLLGWIAFWTYLDPDVSVPDPTVAEIPPRSGDGASILFLGDTAPTDHAMPRIEERGWGYPFSATRRLLGAHDAVVANLEAPVTESGEPWPLPKKWVYKIHPDAVPEIRRAGIDAVVLANNHMNDYRSRGLRDTLGHLEEGGILHVGAGVSEAEARRGLVLETSGGRLGILAYMENKIHWRLYTMAFALDTPFRSWPGVARLGYSDLADDLRRLRRRADAVVVAVHWGSNYRPVTARQEILGRACVDLGADAVIGHHSHEYQPVELYRGRPIVYSLGNYAFGTRGNSRMRFGMGAAMHLERGRVARVEIIPLLTQNRIVDYRPRIPRGEERLDEFFGPLVTASAERGARIERRGDRGWIEIGGGDAGLASGAAE